MATHLLFVFTIVVDVGDSLSCIP